jgi:hypothetical protein
MGLCSDRPKISILFLRKIRRVGDESPMVEEIWMRDDVGGVLRVREGKWRLSGVGVAGEIPYDATKPANRCAVSAVSTLWITKQKQRLLYGDCTAPPTARHGNTVGLGGSAHVTTASLCVAERTYRRVAPGFGVPMAESQRPPAKLECQFIPLPVVSPTACSMVDALYALQCTRGAECGMPTSSLPKQ